MNKFLVLIGSAAISLLLATGCSKREQVIGADGYVYELAVPEQKISDNMTAAAQWKRIKPLDKDHLYFRALQSKNDQNPPMFTKIN